MPSDGLCVHAEMYTLIPHVCVYTTHTKSCWVKGAEKTSLIFRKVIEKFLDCKGIAML